MEAAGLGLSALAEVRALAHSLKDRWRSYKDGPARFAVVDGIVSRLLSVADRIASVTKAHPKALPEELSEMFNGMVDDVHQDIVRSRNIVDMYCSKAFGEGNRRRGIARAVTRMFMRLFKAKMLAGVMNDVEREAMKADNKLQHLLGQLCTVLAVHRAEQNLRNVIMQPSTPFEVHSVMQQNEMELPGTAFGVRKARLVSTLSTMLLYCLGFAMRRNKFGIAMGRRIPVGVLPPPNSTQNFLGKLLPTPAGVQEIAWN